MSSISKSSEAELRFEKGLHAITHKKIINRKVGREGGNRLTQITNLSFTETMHPKTSIRIEYNMRKTSKIYPLPSPKSSSWTRRIVSSPFCKLLTGRKKTQRIWTESFSLLVLIKPALTENWKQLFCFSFPYPRCMWK